ncbi:putative N-alpha-acetyltransferase 30 [Hypsibius exemplaris]|uniref:N-alpha-acetyltransferase 30 n=1 Tax=Hypsibius exemplaris TaxID=2072580 RepID=A0A1W0XCB4_HYPEX|nr:putative N-alpha-acetyltransferase 30 [Hypsibius exemplaris]
MEDDGLEMVLSSLASSSINSAEDGVQCPATKETSPVAAPSPPATRLPEHERQQRVEEERRQKVLSLKTSLVALGAEHGVRYITYGGEHHLHEIMDLITRDLSEPYSIYTYRYFIYQWPKLCHLAVNEEGKVVGAIVCKMENAKNSTFRLETVKRGYIAMLAVDKTIRRVKIGTALVIHSVESLINNGCDEVVLETETTNEAALRLYENLGFARHKRLLKYYLNGVDAFRLKLWLRFPAVIRERGKMSLMESLQLDLPQEQPKA